MNQNGLVLWVLGGAGVTLLYAAYKGKSPLTVLTNHVAGGGATPAPVPPPATPAPSASTQPASGYSINGTSYTVGQDANGQQYVYDQNGSPVATLPTTYATHPASYIPPPQVLGA